MKTINLGTIKIPIEAATKTFAVLAKKGAGKTYTAGVMAEEFAKANIPFVVFDPIDVWWGLRLAANGKDKGLPVVVFGVEHADIVIDRDMGKRIAQEIVKHNISAVISTFGMPKAAYRHLLTEFAEEMLRINNTPRHLFIEEAPEFVPQKVWGEMAKCYSAIESIVRLGRNRGLGVTLISQRAATINKDVLTQIDTLLAFRNTAPQDRKALKEWVEIHADVDNFEKFWSSLPGLPTGEGWIWSPEFMDVFEKVKIRKRETFHPNREKIGVDFKIPQINQTDIKEFVESFAKKPELPAKKQEAGSKLAAPGFPMGVSQWMQYGEKYHYVDFFAKKMLEPHIVAFNSVEQGYKNVIEQQEKYIMEILRMAISFSMEMETISKRKPSTKPGVSWVPPKFIVKPFVVDAKTFKDAKFTTTVNVSLDEGNLGRCPGMIYSFLCKHQPRSFTKRQIGAATGYSPRSSGFDNAVSKLNTMGLIERQGELIKAQKVDLSLAKYINSDFSIKIWLDNLGKCAREIYQILLENPEKSFTKEELAEATPSNYSPTSSGFDNAISALHSTGLAKRQGSMISLNPELLDLQ